MTDALRDYEDSEEETREIMEDPEMMDALRESGKGETYSVEEIRAGLDLKDRIDEIERKIGILWKVAHTHPGGFMGNGTPAYLPDEGPR